MDLQSVLAEVGAWPAADRLRLIEEVRDGLSGEGSDPEPSEELKAEADALIEAEVRASGARAGALARLRFERHFGEVDSGNATGADNDRIDADLAATYADPHEVE